MTARAVTMYGDPATKTAARGWAKRAREELRDAERAMARGDYATAWQCFMTASALCTEAETVAEAMTNAKRDAERAERDARLAARETEGTQSA